MFLAQRLLQLTLLLLWAELLISGHLYVLAAIAIPAILLLSLQPHSLVRSHLNWITLVCLLGWTITAITKQENPTTWFTSLANLLWLMASLKLLESVQKRSPRSSALVLLLSIGLAGIFNQNLSASLLQGSCALLCIAALVALEAGPQPLASQLRRSLMLFAIVMPIVLTCFLLLPRLPALWSLPGSRASRTGLSEYLRPGELASLVQSHGMAARVRFSGPPPPPEQRYWRVLVHRQFDGYGWSQGPSLPLAKEQTIPDATILQQWLVEPSQLAWRPWSGHGLPNTTGLRINSGGGLWGGAPLRQRGSYGIVANAKGDDWRKLPPTATDLALPEGSNPRLEILGNSWRQQSTNPVRRLQLARNWFDSQPFNYTLDPGRLPRQSPLDAFLFDRQRGFCEHYAASFSALMRAAGVPARVVVGYQGGRWQQPLGTDTYLLLKNSDAHAWSEIWLPRRGWVEVDPTSWVVPNRVRHSLAASLNDSDRRLLEQRAPAWLQVLTNQWQGLDTRWQLWVMQFDSSAQERFLLPLLHGQRQWQGLIAVAAIGLGFTGAITLIASINHRQSQQDAARLALKDCLIPLAKLQIRPATGETLQQFCQRAAVAIPEQEQLIKCISLHYNSYRFDSNPSPTAQQLRRLRQQLRAIKAELWYYVRKQKDLA